MFVKMIKHSSFTGNTANFAVKDHFVVRFEPVRISYIGQNIRDYFWDKVIPPMGSRNIVAYLLGQRVSTRDLIERFGGGNGSSLVVAWNLLLGQPYGQGGYLNTNGMTNVFLGFDFSIGVFWYKNGWSIRAYPADALKPRIWHAGNQVMVLS